MSAMRTEVWFDLDGTLIRGVRPIHRELGWDGKARSNRRELFDPEKESLNMLALPILFGLVTVGNRLLRGELIPGAMETLESLENLRHIFNVELGIGYLTSRPELLLSRASVQQLRRTGLDQHGEVVLRPHSKIPSGEFKASVMTDRTKRAGQVVLVENNVQTAATVADDFRANKLPGKVVLVSSSETSSRSLRRNGIDLDGYGGELVLVQDLGQVAGIVEEDISRMKHVGQNDEVGSEVR